MKYTLLDMTQTILGALGGDEVNSITDTTESLDVVKAIRTAYYDLVSRAELPAQYTLFSLDPSNDTAKPVLMTLPEDKRNIRWVKYNCIAEDGTTPEWAVMTPLTLEEFLFRMHSLNTDDALVGSMTHIVGTSSLQFFYWNNRAPTYYTTFDDGTLIFDAYDAAVEQTLQASKSLCYGQKSIPWVMSDTFTPELDDSQFALLMNEAKSLAFLEDKQMPHPIAERNARRGWVHLQKQKTKVETRMPLDRAPNFGRRR